MPDCLLFSPAAKAAGWEFERAESNGNPRALYAVSPTGNRYRWNPCRMDPWDKAGPVVKVGDFSDSLEIESNS